MGWPLRLFLLLCGLCLTRPLHAQLPFYTDDPAVTEKGKLHFEFFDEYDVLQKQYPNLGQNTANYKVNLGLPHNLEFDIDFPYLGIFRGSGTLTSTGVGDTNLGMKWNFLTAAQGSRRPILATSLYIEFPTGNSRQQLGSGLTDYWLNFIVQEPITAKTRVNTNVGFLFAGNTSTGAVGIETTRGHVYTGGASVLHDFTSKLTLGVEVYGGIADNSALGRSQLQFLLGSQYAIHQGMTFDLGLIGGKYVASPRVGGQIGFSFDFPDVLRPERNSMH